MLPQQAHFRFEGRLADLLRSGTGAPYLFRGHPSLKDAIEAMGIPHVEAGRIVVNGSESSGSALLQPGDDIVVYPDNQPFPAARFVLDVHLGSLTRTLRMLGFDSAYRNDYSDPQIVAISVAEERAVLTRDIGLLKHKRVQRGYWLRSQHTEQQAREVLERFGLSVEIRPFRRCLACNGRLHPVSEEAVLASIPPRVLGFQTEYFQCENCHKVYWKGTHYAHMLESIERILK
jgi:uncharacterized protein with PIN domain